MCGQGRAINCWAGPRKAYALCDVENDACEAILVKVDFLMIRNLPYGAEKNVSLESNYEVGINECWRGGGVEGSLG